MSYGNDNLMFITDGAFITTGAASDNYTLKRDTKAVSLYATADAWVLIGNPGETPVAAAPSGEKVASRSFFLPAGIIVDVPVPAASANALVAVAAIQDSASGNVYVYQREDR